MDDILHWIVTEALPWIIAAIAAAVAQRFRKSGGIYAKALRVVTDAVELIDTRFPQEKPDKAKPDSARAVKRLTQAMGDTQEDRLIARAISASAKASELSIRYKDPE